MENCRYTSLQMNSQLTQFFELSFLSISSVSSEQWQQYVKNLRAHQDGSGELDVLMGQSIVLGEIKAEIPLQNENSSKSSNSLATVHGKNRITFTRKQSE